MGEAGQGGMGWPLGVQLQTLQLWHNLYHGLTGIIWARDGVSWLTMWEEGKLYSWYSLTTTPPPSQ